MLSSWNVETLLEKLAAKSFETLSAQKKTKKLTVVNKTRVSALK